MSGGTRAGAAMGGLVMAVGLAGCGGHETGASNPVPSASASSVTSVVASSAPSPVVATSSARALVATPLTFDGHVAVEGRTVTITGSWTGTDRVLSAATLAANPDASTGSKTGSGVLGWSFDVVTASRQPVAAGTDPAADDFEEGLDDTNGAIVTCTGPAEVQQRTAATQSLSFDRPGSYLLTVVTDSCAGERTQTFPFTVPAGAFATQTLVESPVTSAHVPRAGLTVTDVGSGTCEPGSEVGADNDRCFAGTGVYDPCWTDASAPGTTAVLCQTSPWATTASRITLASGGLQALTPGTVDRPWGVELADGEQCIANQGAVDRVEDRAVVYDCGGPAASHRSLLDPLRSGTEWSADSVIYSPTTHSYSASYPVQIVKIWYAGPDASPQS